MLRAGQSISPPRASHKLLLLMQAVPWLDVSTERSGSRNSAVLHPEPPTPPAPLTPIPHPTCGDHVAPADIKGEGVDGAPVAQHLDHGGCDVGCPHGHHAPRVPQAHHPVPGVLAHRGAGAQPGFVGGHDVPRAGVLVVEDTWEHAGTWE